MICAFGYAQQLRRTMGAFSSFAISFSLISITTGIFAGFGFGLQEVGPSVIWSWSVVVAGQLLVAAVIAEMSTRYPLSGYGYQWTSRLASPHLGFFVGWLLLLQFTTGFPGVCHTLATYLHGFLGLAEAFRVSWLTVGIIALIALIHWAGIRFASLFNDYGVVAEIVGVVLITIVLLAKFGVGADADWTALMASRNALSGQAATASSFCLSLLMGAWCLTGFEAAADLAEETHRPREVVPRAVISAELISGVAGFLMLAGFLLAIPDLELIQASDTPLLAILEMRFGATMTRVAMLFVFVSILACGVASMAATTRLIYSMARDNMLPGSRGLKCIHATRQSPTGAILAVWLLSTGVVLSLEKLELITSISATAGYMGYALIVWCSFKVPRSVDVAGRFTLGNWQRPIAALAFVWTLVLVAALTIPAIDGGHLAAISTSCGMMVGLLIYVIHVRGRIEAGQAGPPRKTGVDPS